MTGGVVVVLGSTGRNIGAGMTGGVAFLLDEEGRVEPRVNPEIVEICTITTHEQETLLKGLLQQHVDLTGSEKAAGLLANWSEAKHGFKVLVPPSEREPMGLAVKQAVAA
jgi:glutamate synthase (ferredoxin)